MRKIYANHTGQCHPKLEIAATWNFQAADIIRWTIAFFIINTFALLAARQVWGSVDGIFISASPYEMSGGFLLFGLCLAALGYGLRLVLGTNIAKPNKK